MRAAFIAVLLGCLAMGQPLCAQPAPTPEFRRLPPSGGTNHATRRWTNSPLDSFRQLLAMNPVEREKALAEKPERLRGFLAGRLKEYDALRPDERELRLRLSQLRFHLLPLMRHGVTNRAERLAAIPADDRKLVEDRLQQWDSLPAALRQEVLESEWLVHTVLRFQSSPPAQQQEILASMSPERRTRLESDLATWHALPAEKRTGMLKHFNQFFELSDREKSKILATIPDAQRPQMEKTVHALEKLPAEERSRCMKSLERFAAMTPQEQVEFLNNADRWAKLSGTEKDAIRRLVTQFPPLPPGLGFPPLPPGLDGTPGPPAPLILTNR